MTIKTINDNSEKRTKVDRKDRKEPRTIKNNVHLSTIMYLNEH